MMRFVVMILIRLYLSCKIYDQISVRSQRGVRWVQRQGGKTLERPVSRQLGGSLLPLHPMSSTLGIPIDINSEYYFIIFHVKDWAPNEL